MSSSSEETVIKKRTTKKRLSATSSGVQKTATKRKSGASKSPNSVVKKVTRRTTKKTKSSIKTADDSTNGNTSAGEESISDGNIVSRKAPTILQTSSQPNKKNTIVTTIVLGMVTLLTGTGVWIGTSDPGEIDVALLVQLHNERVERGEIEGLQATSVTVPVQRPALRPADNRVVPVEDTSNASATTTAEEGLVDENADFDTTINEQSATIEDSSNNTNEIGNGNNIEDTSYLSDRHLAQRHPFGLM